MAQDVTTSRLVALCFDANDPLRLAYFWAEALRWEIEDETSGKVRLMPTDHTQFAIEFNGVPEPKLSKNPIHLDLTSRSRDDQQQSVATLVERGARPVDVGQGPDDPHVVLADPEGNEFCIIEAGNKFLAGCERLGSITCDGSRATGYFWAAALGWPLVWIRTRRRRSAHLTAPVRSSPGDHPLPRRAQRIGSTSTSRRPPGLTIVPRSIVSSLSERSVSMSHKDTRGGS
jgi:hypothetical protein